MQLDYKRVESFEVKGILFTCVSKWNGLEEWKDAEGRQMIVCTADKGFTGSVRDIFSLLGIEEDVNRLLVISASPDLVALFNGV